MSIISDYLRSSRMHEVAKQIEAGESVDFDRLAALQHIDIVRIGQEVLADAIEREEAADRQFATNFGQPL